MRKQDRLMVAELENEVALLAFPSSHQEDAGATCVHGQHLPWALRLRAGGQVHSPCRRPAPCAQRPDLGPQGQCSLPALHRDVCGSCLKAELLPWHWADGGRGGQRISQLPQARMCSQGPGAVLRVQGPPWASR